LVNKDKRKVPQRRYSSFWRRWLTRRLIARLRTKSEETRTYMLQALGKIGDETALPVILDAARDASSTIRRFALSALADMGDARAIDTLIDALDDPEDDLRTAAAMGLGSFKDERAEDALIALLDTRNDSVRTQAVISLGNLGSIKALSTLKKIMANEPNEWIRRYISQSILEIERNSCS
jgi:HEAT repeat protein